MMQISRRHFIGGVMAACLAASAATPDAYVNWVGNAADASCYVNQYVDTGVNAQSGTKAEFEIEFAVVDQDHSVLDARYDSSNSGRFYLLHLYHSHFSLGYGEFLEIKTHTVQPDTRYHVISVLETGYQSMVVTNLVTGEEVVNYTASKTPTYNFNTNIYLLACNYNNSYYYTCRARLYGVKIWQKGEGDADYNDANLMRDYRPCMYSGKYEFHEKVSDTLVEGKVKESGSSSNALRLRGPASSPICVDGPPDYLLDYVAGSGKGVIDTGVPGRTGIRVVTDMEWRTASGEKCYLGNYAADRGLGRFYVIHKAFPVGGVTQSVWTAYGDAKRGYPTNVLTGTFAPAYPYRRYRCEADYTDPANVTLSLDGEYLSLVPDGSTTNLVADSADYRVATTNLTVLGCNWGSQGLAWFSSARCYTLKMWEDGTLVRDFLPCLKDGVAGLWNQVDNKIYMPLGKTVAGSVTNDVPICVHEPDRYLDYIQSTGTEYINTGVRGRSDTMAEIEMEWCEVGSDWSFLDARGSINHDTDPNSRFFMWHWASSSMAYGYGLFRYPKNGDPTVVGANNEISQKVTADAHGQRPADRQRLGQPRCRRGLQPVRVRGEHRRLHAVVFLEGAALPSETLAEGDGRDGLRASARFPSGHRKGRHDRPLGDRRPALLPERGHAVRAERRADEGPRERRRRDHGAVE